MLANGNGDPITDLFLVKWSTPGSSVKPYSNRLSPGVSKYLFAPTSERIAYVGILDAATVPQLFMSELPTAGTPSNAVQASTLAGPTVQNDISWLPGSRVLLYRANDVGGAQLHSVLLDSTGKATKVVPSSGTLGSGVTFYQVAPR
jgi:hypothetical protein